MVLADVLSKCSVFTAARGAQAARRFAPELGVRQFAGPGHLLHQSIEDVADACCRSADEGGILVCIQHKAPVDRAGHLVQFQPAGNGLLVASRDHPPQARDLVDELIEIVQQRCRAGLAGFVPLEHLPKGLQHAGAPPPEMALVPPRSLLALNPQHAAAVHLDLLRLPQAVTL